MQRGNRILNQDFPEAWNDYRFSTLLFNPEKISIEEVYMGFTYLRNVYYSFWETIKRTFYTLFDTKSLIATIIAYKFNASYCRAFRNSEHHRKYKNINLKKKFATNKERR
jgi:hypothetical protein